jgi:hypothetical protein
MRPIILIMLLVDLGILVATVFAVTVRRPTADRPRPIWSSFAISLLIIGNVSIQIAGDHPGKPGSDILGFTGPMLIGMGIMCALILLRERRDQRAAAASSTP